MKKNELIMALWLYKSDNNNNLIGFKLLDGVTACLPTCTFYNAFFYFAFIFFDVYVCIFLNYYFILLYDNVSMWHAR